MDKKMTDPAAAESVTVSRDICESQNRYNNNSPSSFKIDVDHNNTYDISWGDITAGNCPLYTLCIKDMKITISLNCMDITHNASETVCVCYQSCLRKGNFSREFQ